MLSFTANAQKEHLRFMGIPITGTITTFQSKLSGKGIKLDSRTSANAPVGIRAFTGDFAGYKANIYVYYDKTSKNVYRAKACIDSNDNEIFERRYNDLKRMVEAKYSGFYEDVDEQDGHESITVRTNLGIISIYTSKYYNSYPTTYTIHVDYEDRANSNKHLNNKMDDI